LEVCPPRPPSLVVEVGGQHSLVAAHGDRGRCSHPLRVCRGQYPTAAPDRTPERVSTRRHRESTKLLQLDCTVTPRLPNLMQAPVTGASGKRSRSLPFCQPHRSRTGPCRRRSRGPTSSSKGPPTMNPAVQLATVRRAAAGPKRGRLVLRQLSSAAAAHTHTAWHARRPSPPTSDPGGTAPRARCGRRARLQPSASDAEQRAHGALNVAHAVESAGDASPTEVEPGTVRVGGSWTWAETIPVRSMACDGASTRVPRSASGVCRGRVPSPSPISSASAWCPHHLVDRTGSRLRGARLLAHRAPIAYDPTTRSPATLRARELLLTRPSGSPHHQHPTSSSTVHSGSDETFPSPAEGAQSRLIGWLGWRSRGTMALGEGHLPR